MEKIHQIFENLYDVNGYLIIPDPGTFDPTTEAGRAELVHFTGYIKKDRFLHRYGADTVVHLIRISEDTSTPTPLHVTNLSEPMQEALRRYRHESM